MGYPEKISPCATCDEVFETEWPEALAFYCGAISDGSRCLLEVQRLRCPRGTQYEITEGPLEGCPKGHVPEEEKPAVNRCREARKVLEEALGANG
jgi:hypothetical protein